MLAGYHFQKRLAIGGADDYVMAFVKGDEIRLVAWTTAHQPHTVVIPVPARAVHRHGPHGLIASAANGRRQGPFRRPDRRANVPCAVLA